MNHARRLVIGGAALVTLGGAAPSPEPPLTLRIGAAFAGLDPARLPPEVEARTLAAVLDTVGTLAFTMRRHANDPYIVRLRAVGGAGEARVPGAGLCLPADAAAGAIAYLIHGAETDDSDLRAEVRISPVVLGPALASAAAADSDGRTFLAAAAAGYTLVGRLSAPFGPMQPRGWMSAGWWGPGAGAAIAARLRGLDAVRTGHAVALGAGAAGGPFQYFFDQTEDKRLVVARAARAAVEAAALAAGGEHGAPQIYEGRAGVFRLADPKVAISPELVMADFDRLEGPLWIYPKFFSASTSVIPALEALARTERDGGLRRDGLTAVELRGPARETSVIAPKLARFEPPTTVIGAKLNWAFMVALYLVRGEAGPDSVSADALRDPAVLRLATATRFVADESLPRAAIVLRYADGTERMVRNDGFDPRQPPPFEADLRRLKFDTLTSDLPKERRAALRAHVETLPKARSMRAWVRQLDTLLSAPGSSGKTRCDE